VDDPIQRASWAGTIVFVVVAALAAVWTGTFDVVFLVVTLGLFLAGTVAFLWAYAVAIQRSRTEEIVVANLFFLQGSAPTPVRRSLLGSAGVEVVAAFAAAAVRPYTALAFGILVPMYGIGLAGLWGARRGEFGPRQARPDARPAKNSPKGSPRARQG
jgi:hypothetical protein